MTVDTIMTREVITVKMDDTALIIRQIFKNAKVHHVLVVENQKLVGVISDRDLLNSLCPVLNTPRVAGVHAYKTYT